MSFDLQSLLKGADRRALAAVVTHLSGDVNAVPDLRDRAAIEAAAMRVLPPYIRGEKQVMPPSDEVLQAAMNLASGETVHPEYAPMIREQMAFGPIAPPKPLNPPAGFNVVIIGAGVTGVCAGLTLDALGLHDFVIFDKNPVPGGTWWLNQYPGCRVDTPSLCYSYSFAIDGDWPHHFSHQPALLKYVHKMVDQHKFGDRLQCNTSVETITWNETGKKWDIDIIRPNGAHERLSANVVIGATGILRIPKMPTIKGMNDFAGPAFHSSAWDHTVSLKGKRVAVIGTGASANQIVPAVAKEAAEVLVYQRSAHWMISHPQYGKALSGDERALIEKIPTYLQWFRFRMFMQQGDANMPYLKIDPNWPDTKLSINAHSAKLREELIEYIKAQVGDRPDLMAKVVPDFPPYGKRMLLDNGWYQALRRDNVRLITEDIEKITAEGVVTTAGPETADIIVYATGFDTDKIMSPIQINGRGGFDARRNLEETLEAYNGTALAHCPNLFITWGPNGLPAHGGNGMFFAEVQVGYIVECLRAMFDNNWTNMEIREQAVHDYVKDMSKQLEGFVWSVPTVKNWYKGAHGRVTAISSKRLIDAWNESKAPVLSDYKAA